MKVQSLLGGKTVGVFFGGQSSEHDISIITGEFVLSELKKQGVNARGVYIDAEGKFYLDEKVSKLSFFKEEYKKKLSSLQSYALDLNDSSDVLAFNQQHSVLCKFFKKSTQISFDFIFPCFHGAGGEDGTFQGLLEFFGVPYAGCGIFASATAIDKGLTKKLFVQESITTTDFVLCREQEFFQDFEKIQQEVEKTLEYPVFVKPTKAGSSIGISKVSSSKDLKNALELAFFYDHEVIIETGVDAVRDLTCAVLSDGEKIIASEVQESIFENGFLNYEDKYLNDGGTQLGESSSVVAPANITSAQKQEIQHLSKTIFGALRGNGMARIDFLLDKKTQKIFANEINTLPGTLYHHLWEKSDIVFADVLSAMVEDGMERKKNNKTQNAHFESDVLNEANSLKLQQ